MSFFWLLISFDVLECIFKFIKGDSSPKEKKSVQNNHTLLFISNTFISNAWLKLANSYAKAKPYPEAELSLFESHPRYQTKIIEDIIKNVQNHVRLFW